MYICILPIINPSLYTSSYEGRSSIDDDVPYLSTVRERTSPTPFDVYTYRNAILTHSRRTHLGVSIDWILPAVAKQAHIYRTYTCYDTYIRTYRRTAYTAVRVRTCNKELSNPSSSFH